MTTRRVKLDRIDRKILKELQADGCITNVKLAKIVGISAPPCLRRVKALEKAGYIKGYYTELNAAMMGYGITVFAQVGLSSQAKEDLRKFEALIQEWPLVREAHMLAGETDYILKIVAADWDEYQQFLTTQLTAAPAVTQVKSSLAISTAKHEPGVPVEVD